MKGRLFVAVDDQDADRAYLDAAGARHLRALRLARGDALCAIVGPGRERGAIIAALERDRAVLALGAELPCPARDPRRSRVLAIGIGDLARMDLIVEKATELGATALQPFVAERSQARAVAPSRLERWRRIARAACEQCGRTVEPEVRACRDLDAVLASLTTGNHVLWLLTPASHPGDARAAASAVPEEAALTLVVGPEGGLTDGEIARVRALGARPLTLGARILRFETAAIAALAASLVLLPE